MLFTDKPLINCAECGTTLSCSKHFYAVVKNKRGEQVGKMGVIEGRSFTQMPGCGGSIEV